MATNPPAIVQLAADVIARCPKSMGAVFSGIAGDKAHSFGFHLAADQLPASDYSLQTARDKAGAKLHPDMASALDISFNPAGMILATNRLIASAKDVNDPRLDGVYEFAGTTNGRTPHPYTVDGQVDDPNNTQGWDDSHVWHVHISIHRDVCNDYNAIKGIADVLAGIPYKEAPVTPHPSPGPASDLPTTGPWAVEWTNPVTQTKRTAAEWLTLAINRLNEIEAKLK